MIIIALFILGLITRLIPHLPNFTPIVAIALFSGAYLNKKYGLWLAVSLYIASDLIIGLHGMVLFTWSSVLLISLIGRRMHEKKLTSLLGYTVASSLLFFVLTNFGAWLSGWYPITLEGFFQCYRNALPFFRSSLAANLLYVGVLFGVYEFFSYRVKAKNLAQVLLLR